MVFSVGVEHCGVPVSAGVVPDSGVWVDGDCHVFFGVVPHSPVFEGAVEFCGPVVHVDAPHLFVFVVECGGLELLEVL